MEHSKMMSAGAAPARTSGPEIEPVAAIDPVTDPAPAVVATDDDLTARVAALEAMVLALQVQQQAAPPPVSVESASDAPAPLPDDPRRRVAQRVAAIHREAVDDRAAADRARRLRLVRRYLAMRAARDRANQSAALWQTVVDEYELQFAALQEELRTAKAHLEEEEQLHARARAAAGRYDRKRRANAMLARKRQARVAQVAEHWQTVARGHEQACAKLQDELRVAALPAVYMDNSGRTNGDVASMATRHARDAMDTADTLRARLAAIEATMAQMRSMLDKTGDALTEMTGRALRAEAKARAIQPAPTLRLGGGQVVQVRFGAAA